MIPFYDKQALTKESKAYFETTLSQIIESILLEANQILSSFEKKKLESFSNYAGNNILANDVDNELSPLGTIGSFPKPSISKLDQWRAISKLLITKQGTIRKSVTKNQGFPTGDITEKNLKNDFIDFLETLKNNEPLTNILDEIQKLPNPRFSESDWQFLEAMFCLLPEMGRLLRDSFIENQCTDFTQIELSALKSLGEADNPTDLLLKTGYEN